MKDFNKGVTTQPQIAYEKPINGSYTYTFSGNVVVTEPSIPEPKPKEDHANGHAYVEIGGLKWATMNVGASSETDYGLYFQWGDTQGYTASQVGTSSGQKAFRWADYKYGNGTSSPDATGMTKYNATDGKTVLEAVDDAAVANWGGSWRMPTRTEMQELTANTTYQWVTNYKGSGINGGTFTATNGAVLFIPAAGYCNNGSQSNVGDFCYYWGSSPNGSSNAYYLYFSDGFKVVDSSGRSYGFAVRPVLDTPK